MVLSYLNEWLSADKVHKLLISNLLKGEKLFSLGVNKVRYFQDFSLREGIPAIEFKIRSIVNHRVGLEASGYGQHDDYGNGAIYASIRDIIKHVGL